MWNAQDNTEGMQCPVCKTLFGKREKTTVFVAHCKDCRATYYWKPWAIKPSVELDKHKPENCGCGRCGR